MDKGCCIPALVDVAENGSEKGKASALELLRLLRDIEQECFESDIATISQDANNCPKGKKSHKTLFGVKSLRFSKSI
ncbi:hypothetical protein QQP08_012755 [Theobroma cacao]|uniref:Uncharacterized protein n=1 Tax=Theobroma cacao TaxID=3641 RepID=A0A061EN78_THECC|nr:Uncharacterized protein TCM_018939 [Theobroma cacao]WRX20268.1 hypothetical protein QQP08_012755 [Theobroma cacao]